MRLLKLLWRSSKSLQHDVRLLTLTADENGFPCGLHAFAIQRHYSGQHLRIGKLLNNYTFGLEIATRVKASLSPEAGQYGSVKIQPSTLLQYGHAAIVALVKFDARHSSCIEFAAGMIQLNCTSGRFHQHSSNALFHNCDR